MESAPECYFLVSSLMPYSASRNLSRGWAREEPREYIFPKFVEEACAICLHGAGSLCVYNKALLSLIRDLI